MTKTIRLVRNGVEKDWPASEEMLHKARGWQDVPKAEEELATKPTKTKQS